jgi:murein L,D-transpeptidase YafK
MSYRIAVLKSARTLNLTLADRIERSFPIALGRNSAADKCIEGDDATPLGEFYVCAKNPRSKYFLSLLISYPNAEDAQRGLTAGLIGADEYTLIRNAIDAGKTPPQHTRLGGEIYIHGRGLDAGDGAIDAGGRAIGGALDFGASVAPVKDWTRGCIALGNADMQELYDLIAVGTAVSITS